MEGGNSSSSKTSSSPAPWIELPPEITSDILQRLGAWVILSTAQEVCTTWWKVSKDPATWRSINISRLAGKRMCRQAVDRSQGQLIDLKLTNLDTESADLISYISERSNQLRRLSLEFHSRNTPIDCLIEAVKKLPLLEELRLDVVHVSLYSCGEFTKTAGNSCPLLKSFSLNRSQPRPASTGFIIDDDVAFAVAKWMPGLRHLGLAGDSMTNQGLEAILDGCIYLESLDLRRCSRLRLDGELGKRCSLQITDLRLGEDDIINIESEDDRSSYGVSESDLRPIQQPTGHRRRCHSCGCRLLMKFTSFFSRKRRLGQQDPS